MKTRLHDIMKRQAASRLEVLTGWAWIGKRLERQQVQALILMENEWFGRSCGLCSCPQK